MSQEVELKLEILAHGLPALMRHPFVASAPRVGEPVTLEDSYFDTPKLRLRARQVALRTRLQESACLQTVKCGAPSSGGLSRRAEWEQPYEGAFDFSRIDDALSPSCSSAMRAA